MNTAIYQYLDRADWALHNATNDELQANVKSHLTAMAVHACQSLYEALNQMADDDTQPDPKLKVAINRLPYVHLIENIRNMDLHGWPLPICEPNLRMVAMVSKPGKPIELTSSHGVEVSVQMAGGKPIVHRTPKDHEHGKFTVGSNTVSYRCEAGNLIVYDFSAGKDYLLLEVIQSFLQDCHDLIKDKACSETAPEQSTEPPPPN